MKPNSLSVTLLTTWVSLIALPASAVDSPQAAAVASAPAPKTPWTLVWHGQVRPRLVVDSGRDFMETQLLEREAVSQRARLGLSAALDGGPTFSFVAQDVRVWGEEGDTLNDASADGFDIHEAWTGLPVGGGFVLKLGRQEIIHDDHRLVGNVGWLQRARSFDGARLLGKVGSHDIDVFWAVVGEREAGDKDGAVPAGRGGDIHFFGAHALFDAGAVKVAPALYGRLNPGIEESRFTGGLRVTGATGALSGALAGYFQIGKLADDGIAAYLGSLDLTYKLDVALAPSVRLFADWLSGDGTAYGVFDTLYATNHKFYGEMDFFLAIPAQTKNLGLIDAGVGLGVVPAKALKASLTGHLMRTTKSDAAGASDLGIEVDTKIVWSVAQDVQLRALYGVFLPGEAMRTSKEIAAPAALAVEHFAYLTCDVGF